MGPLSFDKSFAPTCFISYPYRYDSYEAKHETLKYSHLKEYCGYSLADQVYCQRSTRWRLQSIYKGIQYQLEGQKVVNNLQSPHCRESSKHNNYLNESFQLSNIRYLTGKRTNIYFDLAVLIHNASKLAADWIWTRLNRIQTV